MNKLLKKNPVTFKRYGEKFLHWVEILLGLIVVGAVLIMSWNQIVHLTTVDWTNFDTFIELLKVILQLAIGVEIARLLFSYSLETIIELAVFVVARKLLLLEDDFISLLLGIVALVILFAARHFFMEDDARCRKLAQK